ncbi:cation efflux family protein [Metarhizium robertsii ARSEF 23]|uniref:Cation efflux family protein n=1 Tax=Metarhizium robertsii (strain ARSEF 23 / ATCC MYA-3075) TaxID=655844 RepID=E9ENV6_METRA|nr:cation efflux family protein [Metarhizium robertsii ARSEF 23]EFZ02383.2 cation efflux family protein [Metarhizium robertsii ARSEF 23]
MSNPSSATPAAKPGEAHDVPHQPSDEPTTNPPGEKAAPTPDPDPPAIQNDDNVVSGGETIEPVPVLIASETFRSAKLEDIDKEVASRYTKKNRKKIKSFYSNQNELIDQYLGVGDEEQLAAEEERRMRPKIRFAVYASFFVNLCLFIIQLYAAISTGSLSLFATAADAFMDLVSSCVMLITSKLARRPSIYKFPVGRTRIEPIGIIVFCALMATVAIQLLVRHAELFPLLLCIIPMAKSSARLNLLGASRAATATPARYRLRFPSVHVFFIDHRNDIVVNIFGLVMSIVGDRFVWYLDPIGAICIAILILFSWAYNAFEQIWLLAGKGAPKEYISRLIYVALTHSGHILKVDTCRAYHAGQKYYVEVDIIMSQDMPLKISHDVSQSLQRKLEGLADVERAFVHVDYEHDHSVHEEHKPLYEDAQLKTLREYFCSFIRKRRG